MAVRECACTHRDSCRMGRSTFGEMRRICSDFLVNYPVRDLFLQIEVFKIFLYELNKILSPMQSI